MEYMQLIRYDDAHAFQQRATNWLLQNEAEYNLLLGLTERLASGNRPYQEPVYLATVEEDDRIVGCAIRTPPHKLLLTRMPQNALPLLVEDVATLYTSLPGILGSEEVARSFADIWCRKMGGEFKRGMRQGIYALENVSAPLHPAAGQLRTAVEEDFDLVCNWSADFHQDIGSAVAPSEQIERLISGKQLFIWEDGKPKSIVAGVGRTTHGIRISFVYTPPESRRQGYATTAVAELSHRYLTEGLQFCFLYTDLSNPTSNSIYQRIGYQQVCEVVDYEIS
jgi:uncharacterized protein